MLGGLVRAEQPVGGDLFCEFLVCGDLVEIGEAVAAEPPGADLDFVSIRSKSRTCHSNRAAACHGARLVAGQGCSDGAGDKTNVEAVEGGAGIQRPGLQEGSISCRPTRLMPISLTLTSVAPGSTEQISAAPQSKAPT